MDEGQKLDLVTRLGLRTQNIVDRARAMTVFTGSFFLAAGGGALRPGRLRPKEVLFHFQRAGADALVPVALLSFLMGFVIGIQAITTMSPMGAEARIAAVVTIVTMQEFGPLLTAVFLAGRSGTVFTIETGDLCARGGIGALRERGIDPVSELVLPRVLALLLAGPLLATITTAFSILGGMVLTLWIPQLFPLRYLIGAGDAMNAALLFFGTCKILVFSGLIGLVGCFQGLSVEDCDSGKGASSSFVTALIHLALVDAFFNLVFHVY